MASRRSDPSPSGSNRRSACRRARTLWSRSTGQQIVGTCNYCPAFLDQGLCSPRRFLQGLCCVAHHAECRRTGRIGAQHGRSAMRGEVERHGSLLFCSGGSGLWALSAGNAWACVLPISKTTTFVVYAPPGRRWPVGCGRYGSPEANNSHGLLNRRTTASTRRGGGTGFRTCSPWLQGPWT